MYHNNKTTLSHNNSITLILRSLAVIYDLVIWNVISMGIFLLVYQEEKSLGNALYLLNCFLGTAVFLFFINGFMYQKFGGSIGKKLLFLSVRNQDGNFLSFKEYFFREFIYKNISNIIFGLGYFFAIFDKNHKTFHDLAGNTEVSHTLNIYSSFFFVISVMFSIFVYFETNIRVVNTSFLNKSLNHVVIIYGDLMYHLNK